MAQSQIPTSRVNRIIKADKDVRLCSKEAVFLISKAAVSRPSPPYYALTGYYSANGSGRTGTHD